MATSFTNQATLRYNGEAVQSNITVGLIEGMLSVSKQAVEEQYAAGDTVTYVVSIVNNGGAALSGLTVTDNLGAYAFGAGTVQPLTYNTGSVQYYVDGVLQPDPNVSSADGLALSGISVPAAGNVTIIYSATVNEYAPLETGSSVTNTVTVSGTDVTEATAEESIAVTNAADLSILKSVTPIPVAENGRLTYTFQLFNSGNTAVLETDNAVITDTFDPVLTDIAVTLNGAALTIGTDYSYDENTGEFSTAEGVIAIPAASYTQDAATGAWSMTPGAATLTVTGTIGAVTAP